jgi:hypothetical protein
MLSLAGSLRSSEMNQILRNSLRSNTVVFCSFSSSGARLRTKSIRGILLKICGTGSLILISHVIAAKN